MENPTQRIAHDFQVAAKDWLCNGYVIDVRYVAEKVPNGLRLAAGMVGFAPRVATLELNFRVETESLIAGQVQVKTGNESELLEVLGRAIVGRIDLGGRTVAIHGDDQVFYDSENKVRDQWYYELHLQVASSHALSWTTEQLAKADNELRASTPPFDGVDDLLRWLHLDLMTFKGIVPNLSIRVSPPVDFSPDKSQLRDNKLQLLMMAHPALDTSRVGLAIRAIPGAIESRMQVGKQIVWDSESSAERLGRIDVELPKAYNALVMLMIGGVTVRRQWFVDQTRASNVRTLAVQHFDADLRKINSAVFDNSDSRDFEKGVASLLFMMGFSVTIPVEPDSPDVIVFTPGGQIGLLECTLRTADIGTKIGKLVDRRESLARALQSLNVHSRIISLLVCRSPRAQIAAHESDFLAHRILLVSNEDLRNAFIQVRNPREPDEVFNEAFDKISSHRISAS